MTWLKKQSTFIALMGRSYFSRSGLQVVMVWCVVYHQDKFFVCYCEYHRVVVFNNEGKYVYDIGSEGSGDGHLTFPIGLAIDKFDRLIVCDGGNGRLQLFTLDGKYITKIAGNFFHHGKLLRCALSNTGNLFITGKRKNCIYVFN